MQLPKSRRRQKLREKKCLYPGCGKIFFGIHISKYCPEHRQDRYRIRKRTKPEDVNIKNQTFKHNYTEVVTMVMNCALEGCNQHFDMKIYPRQYIYPKYCPQHRNEYRRVRHLQMIHREDLIEQMKQEGENFELEHPKGSGDEEHVREEVLGDEI
jgi:stress-induced morphogen